MTTTKHCLADNGKHRWHYREDSPQGRLRECQKCGVTQRRMENGRYVSTAEK